jgi:DNA polymerase
VWAPEVPKLWRGLENAAVRTVHDRRAHEAYGITFSLRDDWLTARLLSGRELHYYQPRATRKAMPWDEDDVRLSYSYKAEKMSHLMTIDGYGGLITENVVQALARDLLVHAMFACRREHLPIVLTVHDEIVLEVEEDKADEKLLAQIMADIPAWAREIKVPVEAEVWSAERYKK